MNGFLRRFFQCLGGSFLLLVYSSFVVNYHGLTTFSDLLPGIIVIFLCSIIASAICAALIPIKHWWAILIPQISTASIMLLVYYLIA